MTTDPHACEYLAAVAGLHEQTISPRALPAIGDFVSGTTAGRSWSGYVEWVDGNRMTINADGAWLAVPVTDITH
jgi:hypothetical protein